MRQQLTETIKVPFRPFLSQSLLILSQTNAPQNSFPYFLQQFSYSSFFVFIRFFLAVKLANPSLFLYVCTSSEKKKDNHELFEHYYQMIHEQLLFDSLILSIMIFRGSNFLLGKCQYYITHFIRSFIAM